MNTDNTVDDLISLPTSYVKSPGFLLKDKKRPGEVVSNQKLIQSLFLTVEAKRNSISSMSFLSTSFQSSESSPLTSEPSSPLINSVKSLSPKHLSRVGKINMDYDLSLVLQRSQDILKVYGIKLDVIPYTDNNKEAFDVLRSLVPEICSFRYGFFKKLEINRLVICTDENTESDYSQKNVFITENLTTEEKIHQRLYQIIIEHLAVINPQIIAEWRVTEKPEENKNLQDCLKKMEEAFFILMKNSNSSIIKNELKSLRDLLMKHYPYDMPEDWFTQRKKAKKRMLRVSFDFRSK